MATQQHWDDMYDLPAQDIPWEISEPPDELVALVQSGVLKQDAEALDVACGTGNYSCYLGRQGFRVTGVDFSEKAIAMAKERAQKLGLAINFQVADVRQLHEALTGQTFDFILDYSLLHHIAPADVQAYAAQFHELLKPGGKLLLVCYSEKDNFASGRSSATGKYGNDMYYRTRSEIKELYRGLHEISYQETHLGKRRQHGAHSFIFENHN